MADNKVFQVRPKDGQWQVKEAAARCASGKFEAKADAVARAKELAAKAQAAVMVLKADGSVEKEYPAKATAVKKA